MNAARGRSIPLARRSWPLLGVAATVAGLYLGLAAPAVSPVSPAPPPMTGLEAEVADTGDAPAVEVEPDLDAPDADDRGGPGDRDRRGGGGRRGGEA